MGIRHKEGGCVKRMKRDSCSLTMKYKINGRMSILTPIELAEIKKFDNLLSWLKYLPADIPVVCGRTNWYKYLKINLAISMKT